MLLIIHNLPPHISMANIKKLIKDNCSAEEVILDNLKNEGHGKRVTVGLADESDAALLVRKINGLFLDDHQLFVEDVRQKLADQPYRPQKMPEPIRTIGEKLSDPANQQIHFKNVSSMQIPQMMAPPPFSNMPFYMAPVQNPYVNHDKAAVVNPLPQVPFYQQDLSYGYKQHPENQDRWIEQPVVSYPDKKISLSYSDAKAKEKVSQRDREQDFSKERASSMRERRESPPRRAEDHRRRGKNVKRYNEPEPIRDVRRSLSRERERYTRKLISRYDEFNKSNRSNKIERSPPRDRRFNRDYDDRNRGRGNDRRGSAIKRHRDYNSRERVVYSREQDYGNRDYDAGNRHYDIGNRDYDAGNRDYGTGNRNYNTRNCDYNTANREIDHDGYDFQVNAKHSGFDMPEKREVYNHQNTQEFKENDNSVYGQTYQEPDFEINRSYSEHIEINPTTFSNEPNNSTFTNFNPDKYIQSSTDFNASPAKVPRFSNLNVDKSGFIQPAKTVTNDDTFANKSVQKPFVIPIKPRVNQHSNFFARAAVIITTEVIRKAKVGYLQNYREVCQHLKKCIESRIDVIMQGKIPNTLKEVIKCYRFKFGLADDQQFFKDVLKKTQRGMEESDHRNSGEGDMSEDDYQNKDMSFDTPNNNPGFHANPKPQGNKNQPNTKPKSFGKKKPNPAANAAVQQEQSNRLPRFPQGIKQVFKEQKKRSKMEYMKEDMYNLDPTLLKALNEELYKLCAAYLIGSSQPSVDEDEEKTRLILRKRTPFSFKKVMKIHLTKRLLNVTENLVIRIFAHPKNPNRDELDHFLREVGITSVRKSDTKRLYLATAPSYEVYDHIVAMQHAKIGDITIRFRPLHLTGPPVKKNHSKKKNQPNDEDDDNESVNDEELERLIEETEKKIIEKTENVNVVATGNVEQSAGAVAEVYDDNGDTTIDDLYTSYDELVLAPRAEVVTNDDYTKDIDVVIDNKNDVRRVIEYDNNNDDSKVKKEIKVEGAHKTSPEIKVVKENNDKADNVQVDNSKAKTEINTKSDNDAKENTEIINKHADDSEEGNEINDEADEITVADSAEVNEENLCAVDVDDDELEDF